MNEQRITEKPSLYDNLEQMATADILANINREDQQVAIAVSKTMPQVEKLVEGIVARIKEGGRVFYIGAGTSGRLGVLDASELPPTFGVSPDVFIGLIAGGDVALRNAVEHAEDDVMQGWKDIAAFCPTVMDVVVGIAASGTTPYVVGAIEQARAHGLLTAGITSNPGAPLAKVCDIPIEVNVGPEFVTGSSRMKSGTAQKMILNMISTATMIRLGRVKGNRMVDMQLSNNKLIDRGVRMIMSELNISYHEAACMLKEHHSVRVAIDEYKKNKQ